MVIEKLHTKFSAGLDTGIDTVGLVFTDKIRNSRRNYQKFVSRNSALARS